MDLDFIRSRPEYRGQIVGVLDLPGEPQPSGAATPDVFSKWPKAAQQVLAGMGLKSVSVDQARVLARFHECMQVAGREGPSTIVLVGAPGTGRSTVQLMAAIEVVYFHGMTALWIGKQEAIDVLHKRLQNAWVAGTADAVRCLSLGSAMESGSATDGKAVPSLVLATPESVRREMLKASDNWRNFLCLLGCIAIDDIDLHTGLAGAEAATVLRRLLSLVRRFGAEPVVTVSMGSCSNVASYVEGMIGRAIPAGDKDIVRFARSRLAKRIVFWSSPVDLADGAKGSQAPIQAVPVLDDVKALIGIIAAGNSRVYVAGEFVGLTSNEFEDLRARSQAPSGMIQRVARLEDLYMQQTEGASIVVLGLLEDLGVLCERLAGVGGAETTVFIVSARQPLFNVSAYLARRRRANLSTTETSQAEFPGLPNKVFRACAYPNPYVIVDHVAEELELMSESQAGVGLEDLVATYGTAVRAEVVRALLYSHPRLLNNVERRCSVSGGVIDERVYRLRQDSDVTAAVPPRVPESFPTEYYPQSIINEKGGRHKIVAVGAPWRWGNGLHLLSVSGDDLLKRTQRVFRVSFSHAAKKKPMSTLACGLPWRINTSIVTETITGFRTMDRVSGDVDASGGQLPDPIRETWTAPVLELDFSKAVPEGFEGKGADAKTVNTIRHLIYHAIGGVVIGAADTWECVPLTNKDDGAMSELPQDVARLAIYSRHPGSGIISEAFADDQWILTLLNHCLDVLVACPCRDGCRNCVAPKYHIWGKGDEESLWVDKTGTMRYLAALLKRDQAAAIAAERDSMETIRSIQSRVRDILVPPIPAQQVGLFADQLGLKLTRLPVPLEPLPVSVSGRADGLYTGNAVQVRMKLSEVRYLALIAHEYAHQWQDAMSPKLKWANSENIEDEDNIPFPAFEAGTWTCSAKLYTEGSAQWIAFRVLSAFNDHDGMDMIREHHRDEYGEGFQYLMKLEGRGSENSAGLDRIIQHLLGKKPLYLGFPEKDAMYAAKSLYAAIQDACGSVIENGGLRCVEGMAGWPKYMRLSHYRTSYRVEGMTLDGLCQKSPTDSPPAHLLLELSPSAVKCALGSDGNDLLLAHGLGRCLSCLCRGESGDARPCSLRSALYMHSNSTRSAVETGKALEAALSTRSLVRCTSHL